MKILSIKSSPNKFYRNSFKAWDIEARCAIANMPKLKEDIDKQVKEIPEDLSESVQKYGLSHLFDIAGGLEALKKRTEYINEAMEGSTGADYSADRQAITRYIEQVLKLEENDGLNKIYGYDSIKDKVFKNFIVKVMAKDKTARGAKVPNAILFYGPTGCGKTLFADALAQQSLANTFHIRSTAYGESEEDVYNTLRACAKKSKRIWQLDPEHKKRTIFIFNEAEMFMYPESPVLDKFKSFLSHCSDEYKCTVFLTSNFPNDIDESILSENITPYKIYIPPAERKDVRRLITSRLKILNRPPIDINKFLSEIFSQKNQRYTNYQILKCIDDVELKKDPKYELDEYIDILHTMHPIINKSKSDEVEKFMRAKYPDDIIS